MIENIIQTSHLTKTFKHQHAVNDVSLTIKRGEIYGLIGKNGAGKTTLIKLITSLIKQTSGSLSLFGATTPSSQRQQLKRVGCVIESPVAYPNLSAKENLKHYCIQFGILNPDTAIQETLDKVGLNNTGKKQFKNFSLGMKQRLGIAIALLSHPDFLILDEPINGLDPIGIMDFRLLLEKLNKEEGITILISSHILSELYHVATTFGFIDNGKLIKELTKEAFDEECNESITFKINDAKLASIALEKNFTDIDYKVITPNEIRIYNHFNDIPTINAQFVQQHIEVSGIVQNGTDLEMYFKDLVAGGPQHD